METSQSDATERFNTVVIGAGQAGLATAYHLTQSGVNFVVLEAAQKLGHTWRGRWDSLHLETPVPYDSLPGLEFPNPSSEKWYLPTKDEAAAYLEKYAAHFAFPIRMGTKVVKLTKEGDLFVVTTNSGQRIEAERVVVASGFFQTPKVPDFAGQLDPSIVQFHSSAYRNPDQLQAGDALVVGAASSGSQISMELSKSHKTFLAGRSVGNIPRRVPPGIGVNIFRVFPFVVTRTKTSFLGKKLYQEALHGGRPLVRFTYKDVKKTGVERVGKVTGVTDGKPVLEDGTVLDVTNVVWATGWRADYSWIDLPILDEKGEPKQDLGVVDGMPGLYFVGIAFQHSESSALMFGVGRDSKYVVEQMQKSSPAAAQVTA